MSINSSMTDITWEQFREIFKKNGGDSFYACWSLSYLEPALEGMSFSENNIIYKRGLCPIAESIQPFLIQLKTNYPDMKIAIEQAKVLKKTINELS